jgi:hypothetical protein
MPDIKEVHGMVTQRKNGMFAATLVIAAGILAACSSSADDTRSGDPGVTTQSVEATETPGATTHTLTTGYPPIDGSYVITMKILDGYEAAPDGHVVFGSDGGQGISTWAVGNVFANPCHSNNTLLDPPIDPSVDGLVTGLASQKGHPATMPTDVEVDGYAGKYMEMTVPAGIDVADCDHGEYRTWADPIEGERSLEAGQRDLLWIVDVAGDRLVIDVALGPQTTEQDRADRIHMVKSIQIDPV